MEQIKALSESRCSLFTRNQTSQLNATTSRNFVLSQISDFSTSGILGLSADFYGNLTQQYSIAFSDIFSAEKLVLEGPQVATDFKRKVNLIEISRKIHLNFDRFTRKK
jgi:hypothetical protein